MKHIISRKNSASHYPGHQKKKILLQKNVSYLPEDYYTERKYSKNSAHDKILCYILNGERKTKSEIKCSLQLRETKR